MLENICGNIGVSKADQSNSMADACAHHAPPRGAVALWTGGGHRAHTLRPHAPSRAPSRARSWLIDGRATSLPAVGNMNIGQYSSLSGEEKRRAEAQNAAFLQAAEAARIRQMVREQNR